MTLKDLEITLKTLRYMKGASSDAKTDEILRNCIELTRHIIDRVKKELNL